jgi:hypothetical protein
MAGATESEGTTWAISGNFGQKLNNESIHITKTELKTQIKAMFHSTGDAFAEKIYDFYISHIDENNQTLIRESYIAIFTDTIIKCPTYYFSEKLAQFSASNKIYFYELTFNSKSSICHSQEWKGICHNDDLAFVFGYAIRNKLVSPQIEYDFSVLVNTLWTNFAKYGYKMIDKYKLHSI